MHGFWQQRQCNAGQLRSLCCCHGSDFAPGCFECAGKVSSCLAHLQSGSERSQSGAHVREASRCCLPASTANMRAALALQGGSVAAILAVELAAAPPGQRMSAPTLVTFGEPRTGDAAFADAVTALIPNAQRVVHNRDIIPHYPFREMPSTARNGSVYKYHLVLCFETYKC
jgi:hypothetical protein